MTTILVIEDEATILENILETLEFGEFTAFGAQDGQTGIKLARLHLPDLILSDIMLPEMDGYQVLAELRSDPTTASIPFIFMSAMTDRETSRQAMERGANGYLTKPFTPAELLIAVRTGLDR
jgi:DNA-binding response OmpR family regulator